MKDDCEEQKELQPSAQNIEAQANVSDHSSDTTNISRDLGLTKKRSFSSDDRL